MLDEVKNYYGETLKSSHDLQTNACCTEAPPPAYIRDLLASIHDDVSSRYYGCGLVVPEKLNGAHILDLGSGAGRDCFLLSALVGENGSVTGIDMTEQQLDIATMYIDYHQQQLKYQKPNVRFLHGELENLHTLSLPDNSFDIIISNCVLNLCMDKLTVLKQAWRLLKPGGEMYFSDVYADRRVPEHLQKDPQLYGECLSGALYWNDFVTLAKQAGFQDPRLVKDSPITIENEQLEEKVGSVHFYSATYRLFKIQELESACEDYGQTVIYKGSIEHHPHELHLDKHHLIQTGKVFPVCGNTYRMLNETRLREHFDFLGTWDRHFGIFDGCGTAIPFTHAQSEENTACC